MLVVSQRESSRQRRKRSPRKDIGGDHPILCRRKLPSSKVVLQMGQDLMVVYGGKFTSLIVVHQETKMTGEYELIFTRPVDSTECVG